MMTTDAKKSLKTSIYLRPNRNVITLIRSIRIDHNPDEYRISISLPLVKVSPLAKLGWRNFFKVCVKSE